MATTQTPIERRIPDDQLRVLVARQTYWSEGIPLDAVTLADLARTAREAGLDTRELHWLNEGGSVA